MGFIGFHHDRFSNLCLGPGRRRLWHPFVGWHVQIGTANDLRHVFFRVEPFPIDQLILPFEGLIGWNSVFVFHNAIGDDLGPFHPIPTMGINVPGQRVVKTIAQVEVLIRVAVADILIGRW